MGSLLDTSRHKNEIAKAIFRLTIDLNQIGTYCLASREKEAKRNLTAVLKTLTKLHGKL